ncbi:MAG: hypothetical protein QM783_19105 [Phycisphaerales bacterium]
MVLLMTALLRWLGCDLFIHGLGGGASGDEAGGGYDKVAERWFAHWLGNEAALAPSVVATATVLLPLGESGPLLTESDLLDVQHKAHRGRHHPRILGDAGVQAEKDRLVGVIAASTDRGAPPAVPRSADAAGSVPHGARVRADLSARGGGRSQG